VLATSIGARATMKQDEYGSTLLKFDGVIPYSGDSFSFPLHIEHVFFADEVDKPGWKVVLLKDPKDTRVASEVDERPELQYFTIGKDKEHLGLIRKLVQEDVEKLRLVLQNSQVLSKDKVNRKLLAIEEEANFEDVEGTKKKGVGKEEKELYN
jgi:hypothetical protein